MTYCTSIIFLPKADKIYSMRLEYLCEDDSSPNPPVSAIKKKISDLFHLMEARVLPYEGQMHKSEHRAHFRDLGRESYGESMIFTSRIPLASRRSGAAPKPARRRYLQSSIYIPYNDSESLEFEIEEFTERNIPGRDYHQRLSQAILAESSVYKKSELNEFIDALAKAVVDTYSKFFNF